MCTNVCTGNPTVMIKTTQRPVSFKQTFVFSLLVQTKGPDLSSSQDNKTVVLDYNEEVQVRIPPSACPKMTLTQYLGVSRT